MTEPVFVSLERPHGHQGPPFACVSRFPTGDAPCRQRLSDAAYGHLKASGDMTALFAAEPQGDHYNLLRPLTVKEAYEEVPF